MKITHLILLLLYCSYDGESSFLIFSSTSQTWFSANQKCKTEYNGHLADIDEIKEGSNNRKFTTCLNGSHELWTGEVLYTTDYISYKGCYSGPDFFHRQSLQIKKMTVPKCQLNCRFSIGFALKDNYCQCIYSYYALSLYAPVDFKSCSFICTGQYCGFYGGNHTVSIYLTSTQRNLSESSNSSGDSFCIIGKCVKPAVGPFEFQYRKISCEQQSSISAYCENGAQQNNVRSWNEAVRFCVNQASHLTTLTPESCTFDLQVWRGERKYQDVIRSKGTYITEDATFSCISTNLSNVIGRKDTSSNCHQNKSFVCVSDTSKAGKCKIYFNASNPEIESTKRTFLTSTSTAKNDVLGSSGGNLTLSSKYITGVGHLTFRTGVYTTIPPTQDSSTMAEDHSIATNWSIQSESKTSSSNTPIIIGVTMGVTGAISAAVLAFLVYLKRTGCVQRKRKSTTNTLRDLTDSSNTRSCEKSMKNDGNCGRTSESGESVYDEVRDAPKDMEAYYNERFENDSTERDDHTYLELGQREESHYDVIVKQKGHQSEGYEVPISKRLYENIKR